LAVISLALATMAQLSTPSLFSPQWHRVGPVKPRWCLGVHSLRQYQRGQLFYIVSNSSSSHSLKLNSSAWEIFARCQGGQTVNEIWLDLQALHGEDAPTQSDMLEIIVNGFEANLLQSRDLLSFDLLNQQQQKQQRGQLKGRFSPFGIRFDIGNPNRWLTHLKPLAQILFSPAGAMLWLIAMMFLLTQALTQQNNLMNELSQQAALPGYWLTMWLCFIPIKTIHELSHALAASAYGIETRQVGIHWMWLSPAPFVDVSGAEQLPSRTGRVAISAAGIAAELALAALALLVWQKTDAGLLHNIALATFSTAGLSTLIFNGNPLVKMDGYYVLSDLLQLPNLAARSQQWWSARWQTWLGNSMPNHQLVVAKREGGWLAVYAPASWLWRVAIFTAAWYWLGGVHRWLGIAMGGAGLVTLVVMPIYRAIKASNQNQIHFFHALRHRPQLLAIILIAMSALTLVPVPDRLLQPGIIWLAGDEAIKAQADGFTAEQGAKVNTSISQPLPLFDPKLQLEMDRVAARIKGIKVKMQQALGADLTQAAVFEKELEQAQAQQVRAVQKLEKLTATSVAKGQAVWSNSSDLAGRWVRNGETLGYVIPADDRTPILIQVALDQPQAARVAASVPHASVYLVSSSRTDNGLIAAKISQSRPSALTELPSAALSSHYGGPIATDPSDPKALKPLQPTFGLQLSIDRQHETTPQWIHSAQIMTVLDFGYSPLAWQWLRSVQEQIRSRFAVQLV
jgi:putative peptide zinc metalloprotease protein